MTTGSNLADRKLPKSDMREGEAVRQILPLSSDLLAALEADVKVIWRGRVGFNLFSSPLFTVALLAVTVFTIWALEGYVPSQSSGSSREQFFQVAIRPILIILLVFQILAMLERRAVTSGRAMGDIMLTNRRLLRICTWPKLRVRAADYQSKQVSGFGGLIWVGEIGWFTLSPSDAAQVRSLINSRKTEANP